MPPSILLSLIQSGPPTLLSPCTGFISVDKALQSPHVLSCLIGPHGLILHLITQLVFMPLSFQGRVFAFR